MYVDYSDITQCLRQAIITSSSGSRGKVRNERGHGQSIAAQRRGMDASQRTRKQSAIRPLRDTVPPGRSSIL